SRHGHEAWRQLAYAIAMAHPHIQPILYALRQPCEERLCTLAHVCAFTLILRLQHLDPRRPILAPASMGLHASAELVRQKLHTIADTQHRQITLQDGLIYAPCARVIDAIRPTGEDDTLRPQSPQLRQRRARRQQLAVDMALAHASGDQAAVLRAVI